MWMPGQPLKFSLSRRRRSSFSSFAHNCETKDSFLLHHLCPLCFLKDQLRSEPLQEALPSHLCTLFPSRLFLLLLQAQLRQPSPPRPHQLLLRAPSYWGYSLHTPTAYKLHNIRPACHSSTYPRRIVLLLAQKVLNVCLLSEYMLAFNQILSSTI